MYLTRGNFFPKNIFLHLLKLKFYREGKREVGREKRGKQVGIPKLTLARVMLPLFYSIGLSLFFSSCIPKTLFISMQLTETPLRQLHIFPAPGNFHQPDF